MGKKDTKSKYVNALNCVFIVIHIDSSIAAQDGFGFVTWCLQVKTCKQIYDEYISEKTAHTHTSKIVLAFNFFFFFFLHYGSIVPKENHHPYVYVSLSVS